MTSTLVTCDTGQRHGTTVMLEGLVGPRKALGACGTQIAPLECQDMV